MGSRTSTFRRACLAAALLFAVIAVAISVPPAGQAQAQASARPNTPSHHHKRGHRHGRRVGGRVHRAWPERGRAPRTRLARWLGRQVGPAKHRSHRSHRAPRVSMNAVAGDPGSPAGAIARIAAGPASGGGGASASASAATEVALPLQLVRSYEIPADDPLYKGLVNWSWTYDSAVAAAAFAAGGDRENSAQLLDQIAALQHVDGSIELAFNVASGESAQIFRSGTVAWAGLAAATYDRAFGVDRYLATEQRAADYLISLEGTDGLVRGGPDVKWYSTEHNLTTYVLLSRLAAEYRTAGNGAAAARYQSAATALASAINADLLVVEPESAHFRQGLGDDVQALDAQALGAMYLEGTGQHQLAAQVLAYAQANFAVAGRSVRESANPATYNMTYSAKGPFSGYSPYAGKNAPDVIWAEGSGEMRVAAGAVAADTSALDKSIAAWSAITAPRKQAPLQVDETVFSSTFGVDYHVWPASTAAAWTMLAPAAPAFFAAPLPAATTLVAGWSKVKSPSLTTTYTDGRVDMLLTGTERRVLAGPPAGTDYTVTSTATLRSGAGYGVYVRAAVDSGNKLSGYCVQMDHAYGTGQIVIREILGDAELTVPIAHVAVPAGFAWYGTPHVVGVTVKGNTMSVTLDEAKALTVTDLNAASAASVKYSYGAGSTLTAPSAGGYGLRAWSDGLVSLQQMTVGPAG